MFHLGVSVARLPWKGVRRERNQPLRQEEETMDSYDFATVSCPYLEMHITDPSELEFFRSRIKASFPEMRVRLARPAVGRGVFDRD